MFSGKTSALLDEAEAELRRGGDVALLVPEVDDRHGRGVVASHDGRSLASPRVLTVVAPAGPADLSLVPPVSLALVDEAQFWHRTLAREARRLADRPGGPRVVVAGLDVDYLRRPFETTAAVAELADAVVRRFARCTGAAGGGECGAPAALTARLVGGAARVLVGGAGVYAPRCHRCHGGVP